MPVSPRTPPGVLELLPPQQAFLAGSERARLQWKLEQQLAAFEAE